MSPKLFIYKGIQIVFFSDDHLPIHVHALYGEMEMKVVFYFKNNRLRTITYEKVEGKKEFNTAKLKDLKKLIIAKKGEIVDKWLQYYVGKGKIETQIIHRL